MTGSLCILVLVLAVAAARAAPPAPPRLYQPQPHHAPAQLQNINPYDYFGGNPEVAQYYNEMVEAQLRQKQTELRQVQNEDQDPRPARLENLENPDSEVELIPGAQQPQQPPQQAPVNPNVPGLIPGQRVFIVHMPVPGYRPGTLGGYQPVYIVAAAPQGNPQVSQGNPGYANNGYAANGYQNAILLNPQGQGVLNPFFGYPGGLGVQGQQGGLLVGAPLPYRGFEGYQNQNAYQQPQGLSLQVPPGLQGPAGLYGPQGPQGPQGLRGPQGADIRGPVQFGQLLNLQNQQQFYNVQGQPQLLSLQGQPVNSPRSAAVNEAASNTEPKRAAASTEDSKEAKRNARPAAQAQVNRNKA